MQFTSNPIVFKNNNIPYKIIPLAIDVEEEEFKIEVYNLAGVQLAKATMTADTFLSIEGVFESAIILYRTLDDDDIKEERVDFDKDKVILDLETEQSLLEQLMKKVKDEMDFPEGTQAEVQKHTEMLKRTTMDNNARMYVSSKIRNIISSSGAVRPEEVETYVYKIYSDLYGMGIIQELDDDIEVGEIMVNGAVFPKFKCDIYYIKHGKKHKFNKDFKSLDEMKQVFARSVEFNKKELNSVENAVVEATRANRDRVNILIPEASDNYILNIRKFANFVPDLNMMKRSGTVDSHVDDLMEVLVKGKANIGIGGEMGTGKTTFINFLLTYTAPIERKVVIASVSETDVDRVLKGHDVVVMNVNEDKGFTFDKLIKASLRTTASRVVIPESRGGEFKQVYEANLKTKGNMFTAHALDDESFLDMCTDMYLSSAESANESSEYIKTKLAKSIDIIIIMRKVGEKIRIKSISEVTLDENRQYAGMNVLYQWCFDPERPLDGYYEKAGTISDALRKRLNENGVSMTRMEHL